MTNSAQMRRKIDYLEYVKFNALQELSYDADYGMSKLQRLDTKIDELKNRLLGEHGRTENS